MNKYEFATGTGGRCYWFTGLPGAGKSTLAQHMHRTLRDQGVQSVILDGDTLRKGLNSDLGFSREDRHENVRRIAEVARLLVDSGLVVLVAAISPYRDGRALARARFADNAFTEIYVATDLATCIARDPKGLYARAKAGEIAHLTGWDDAYEIPERPQVVIDTAGVLPSQAVALILNTGTSGPVGAKLSFWHDGDAAIE